MGEWPDGVLDRVKVREGKGRVVGRRIGIMRVVEREGYVLPGYVVKVEVNKGGRPLGNVLRRIWCCR